MHTWFQWRTTLGKCLLSFLSTLCLAACSQKKVQFTLAFMGVAAFLFFLACMLRFLLRVRAAKRLGRGEQGGSSSDEEVAEGVHEPNLHNMLEGVEEIQGHWEEELETATKMSELEASQSRLGAIAASNPLQPFPSSFPSTSVAPAPRSFRRPPRPAVLKRHATVRALTRKLVGEKFLNHWIDFRQVSWGGWGKKCKGGKRRPGLIRLILLLRKWTNADCTSLYVRLCVPVSLLQRLIHSQLILLSVFYLR
jgi:hypothetical protein